MKQRDVVFDTSVVIAFSLPRLGEWVSVVVIEELAAGAKDKADIKSLSLIRDVLIARTAKREKLTVVSDNKDFPLIHRYYEFDWVSGKEFFNN